MPLINEALEILEQAGYVTKDGKFDISVFAQVKIHGSKVETTDDTVEINGKVFKFKIDTDLRYELQVLIRKFGKWCSTKGRFNGVVLEKSPEQLKNMILARAKDLKWKLTTW